MSEPWDQSGFDELFEEDSLSFEDLMRDDSPSFLADDTAFHDFVDWRSHYPLEPQELIPSGQSQAWTGLTSAAASSSPKTCNPISTRSRHIPIMLGNQGCPSTIQSGYLALGSIHPSYPLNSLHNAATEYDPPNMSQPPVQGKQLKPKEKPHRCNKPGCSKRFVHKGDLSRHTREQHTGEEYLCPLKRCSFHRQGQGFKRMHRLVNHLFNTNNSAFHPVALTWSDAEYIAMDYNSSDKLENPGQMVLDMHATIPSEAAKPDARAMNLCNFQEYTGLLEYLDRFVSVACPKAACPMFILLDRRNYSYDLLGHLQTDHMMPWGMARVFSDRQVAARRVELDIERKRSKKTK